MLYNSLTVKTGYTEIVFQCLHQNFNLGLVTVLILCVEIVVSLTDLMTLQELFPGIYLLNRYASSVRQYIGLFIFTPAHQFLSFFRFYYTCNPSYLSIYLFLSSVRVSVLYIFNFAPAHTTLFISYMLSDEL